MKQPESKNQPSPVYDVGQFLRAYPIGRTKFYQEIAAGRIRVMKVGRRTLITKEAAAKWQALCEQAATGEAA